MLRFFAPQTQSQFADTSEDGLIRGDLIPKKTQDSHVKKRGLDCGFSHFGSQLSHHFFLKSRFTFLDWKPAWVPGLLRAARAVAGLEVWVQAPQSVPADGLQSSPSSLCAETVDPHPGRRRPRAGVWSPRRPRAGWVPAPLAHVESRVATLMSLGSLKCTIPAVLAVQVPQARWGDLGASTWLPGAASGRSGSPLLAPPIANAAPCKETGVGDCFGEGIFLRVRAGPCAALDQLSQRNYAKVRSWSLPPPSGPCSTWRKRSCLGWARSSASPAAVCSTATRGRYALVLCPGASRSGVSGCASLLRLKRGSGDPSLRTHTPRPSTGEGSQTLQECRRRVPTPVGIRPP